MKFKESNAMFRSCPMTFNQNDVIKGCKASKCMAWRWYEDTPFSTIPKEHDLVREDGCLDCGAPFDDLTWDTDHKNAYVCPKCREVQNSILWKPEERRGYCGLAGKPEDW